MEKGLSVYDELDQSSLNTIILEARVSWAMIILNEVAREVKPNKIKEEYAYLKYGWDQICSCSTDHNWEGCETRIWKSFEAYYDTEA